MLALSVTRVGEVGGVGRFCYFRFGKGYFRKHAETALLVVRCCSRAKNPSPPNPTAVVIVRDNVCEETAISIFKGIEKVIYISISKNTISSIYSFFVVYKCREV